MSLEGSNYKFISNTENDGIMELRGVLNVKPLILK